MGDLHFSLFKRRHSSVHHHSTVNLMKRNKPITKFLLKKSAAVQKRLVSFARRKAVSVREEHRQREKAVIIERQQYLQEQKVKSDLLTARRQSRKMEVIRAAQDHGGLCLCRESLEELLLQHRTKTAKFLALGVQLHYHRNTLGSNNRLFQKNRLSVDIIKEKLIQYFETQHSPSTTGTIAC